MTGPPVEGASSSPPTRRARAVAAYSGNASRIVADAVAGLVVVGATVLAYSHDLAHGDVLGVYGLVLGYVFGRGSGGGA